MARRYTTAQGKAGFLFNLLTSRTQLRHWSKMLTLEGHFSIRFSLPSSAHCIAKAKKSLPHINLILEFVPTESNLITTTHTFSLVRVDFKTVAYLSSIHYYFRVLATMADDAQVRFHSAPRTRPTTRWAHLRVAHFIVN
jgi:hypothetical protein